MHFPSTGLVRLVHILRPLGPVPVSKSTWWAGVKSGRFPSPTKLGPRITCWRAEDIQALIHKGDPIAGPCSSRVTTGNPQLLSSDVTEDDP